MANRFFSDPEFEDNTIKEFEALGPLSSTPVRPQPETPDTDDDTNVLADIGLGVVRGGLDAVQDIYSLADFVVADTLPDWDSNPLGESKTTAGKVVQGITNFAVGFIPVLGQVSKISKLGRIGKAAVAGGITDFLVFDGQEERLSNLIQSVPALENPITEFLAADKEDNEIVGRLKNVLEGAGIGIAFESLHAGLRVVKAGRAARARGEAIDEAIRPIVKQNEGALQSAKGLIAEGDSVVNKGARPPKYTVNLDDQGVRSELSDLIDEFAAAGKDPNIKRTGAVNLSKIKAGKGTKITADAVSEMLRKDVKSFSETELKELIESNTKFLEDGLKLNPRRVLSELIETGDEVADIAAKTTQLVAGYRASLKTMTNTAKELLSNQGSDEIVGSLQKQFRDFVEISFQRQRGFSAVSGALRSGKAASTDTIKNIDPKLFTQLLGNDVGPEAWEALARQLVAAGDGVGQARILRSVLDRTFRSTTEFWRNSILSGPTTHAVNTVSNALHTLVVPLETALGGAVTGNTSVIRRAAREVFYLFDSITDATRMAAKVMKTGTPILDPGSTAYRESVGNFISKETYNINNKALGNVVDFVGNVVNLPQRFLATGDEWFKQLVARSQVKADLFEEALNKGLTKSSQISKYLDDNFGRVINSEGQLIKSDDTIKSLRKQAREAGVKNEEQFVTDALRNLDRPDLASANNALAKAREITFQTELPANSLSKKLQALTVSHPTLQFVLPFVKTPVNLIKFAAKRVPVLSAAVKSQREQLLSKNPAVRAAAVGRQMTGLALTATAGTMAAQGTITGFGPKSSGERKALMATGWRPYSFKIGDEYISFQRMDPYATFFGVMADLAEVTRRADAQGATVAEQWMSAVQVAMVENISNKTYLQGIANALDFVTGDNPKGVATRFLGSFVPNVLAKFRPEIDDKLRDVRSPLDAFLGRLPGASDSLAPRRNVFGEEITDKLKGAFVDAKWINPVVLSPKVKDPALQEMADLGMSIGDPSPTRGGVNMLEFEDESTGYTAYDRFLSNIEITRIRGKTLRQAIELLIRTSGYKKLAPESLPGVPSPRINKIRSLINKYRKKAHERTMRELPAYGKAFAQVVRLKQGVVRGLDPQTLLAASDQNTLPPSLQNLLD